eukprot:TRINITY_DN396_c0_g1_i1.p2 TRINITY_DN396_c0_g1~~TRINITY_DN396_c0_g1_i1.p2  ORF type:complete len:205 (-),score=54.39 TRINITY_DN396_c0_g1_i1:127-741(-)
MLKALALVSVAFVAVSAQVCTNNGLEPLKLKTAQKAGENLFESVETMACSWYNDETCCQTFDELYALHLATTATSLVWGQRCSDKINLLACAQCQPKFGTATTKNLCKDFVDEIYDSCFNVNGVLRTVNDVEAWQPFARGEDKLRVAYGSAAEFYDNYLAPMNPSWEHRTYEFLQNSECFNSASGVAASAVVVFAALLLSLILA